MIMSSISNDPSTTKRHHHEIISLSSTTQAGIFPDFFVDKENKRRRVSSYSSSGDISEIETIETIDTSNMNKPRRDSYAALQRQNERLKLLNEALELEVAELREENTQLRRNSQPNIDQDAIVEDLRIQIDQLERELEIARLASRNESNIDHSTSTVLHNQDEDSVPDLIDPKGMGLKLGIDELSEMDTMWNQMYYRLQLYLKEHNGQFVVSSHQDHERLSAWLLHQTSYLKLCSSSSPFESEPRRTSQHKLTDSKFEEKRTKLQELNIC